MKTNKLIIAAGTGFLGKALISHFERQFAEIVVLTRGGAKMDGNIRYVNWNANTMTGWEHELENADALINLTGKSVDCRYTDANQKQIMASRINSTRVLTMAVMCCQNPPKHWLNASTATIYEHAMDYENDETSTRIGNNFSMNVAKAWETAFFETDTPKTQKTALRTSIVLGKNGGAFVPLKNLVKFGFGGKQGDGKQFVSWIHEKDFARAVEFVLEKQLTGIVNIVAPKPIRNSEFMSALRKAMRVRGGIAIGKKLLELGAKIIGTETELVLKSRSVVPKRLLESGFAFKFGDIDKAFENLTD